MSILLINGSIALGTRKGCSSDYRAIVLKDIDNVLKKNEVVLSCFSCLFIRELARVVLKTTRTTRTTFSV